MKQLFVKLQTPTIELTVKAKDSSGAKDSAVFGFVRTNLEESDKELKVFAELLDEQLENAKEGVINTKDVNEFIKSKILYLKQAKLEVYDEDTDKTVELQIPDTRKAKKNEDFWEDAGECLIALLDLYLSASPWRSSIINALQKALVNVDYEEDLKNL